MQTSKEFAPRFPTQQEIQRGMARGRRERALAVNAMVKALFDFLIGRRVKTISGVRSFVHQTA